MSVFLTPDGRPFYGGTYFPDQPRHGLPSFRQVLARIGEAWRERPRRGRGIGDSPRRARPITGRRAAAPAAAGARGRPASSRRPTLDAAVAALERDVRRAPRRLGRRAEVPAADDDRASCLREHVRTGDERPLAMARRTLDAMAAGGIYDHLGGGFARYATDAIWLVPHFEKMLYDNAQLARVYVHAWQVTGDAALRARWPARRSTSWPASCATRPTARSPRASTPTPRARRARRTSGRPSEVRARSWAREAALFEAAYDVTDDGNWEGRTILRRVRATPRRARRGLGRRRATTAEALAASPRAAPRGRATSARSPARDDKVLTAGTASRSPRSPTRAAPSAKPLTRDRDRGGRLHPARAAHAGRPAAAILEGRRARSTPACSRTTPTSPTGCSRCTRRRSTSAGSSPRASSTDSMLAHFARPRRRLLRHGRRCRDAHRAARAACRTTPCRRAARWPRPCCCDWPR